MEENLANLSMISPQKWPSWYVMVLVMFEVSPQVRDKSPMFYPCLLGVNLVRCDENRVLSLEMQKGRRTCRR